MSTCIRRPSAFWTSCKCPPCALDKNRKSKMARTIGIERVPSAVAWETVDGLLHRGWTGLAIATSAGVPRRSIEGALTTLNTEGRRATFGPMIAAKLVAHGRPTDGQIGATGARRRLQGLAVQGWDLGRLSPLTGVNESTLAAIRSGVTERVSVRMHDAIETAADQIGMRVGESRQARQNADRKGWAGLLAWEDIDNPDETPVGALEDSIDPVVVDRLLAGNRVPSTRAEKVAAMTRWMAQGRSQRSLCLMHGWQETRYVVPQDGAA